MITPPKSDRAFSAPFVANLQQFAAFSDDSGSSTSNDEAARERARSNCLLSMRKAGDLRQPDYARTLTEMLRRRFDAVAQARIPDQLSNLVERIGLSPDFASSGDRHTAKASEEAPEDEAG